MYIYTCVLRSVIKSYLTLCSPMDCSMPACSVLYYLLVFVQIHIY